ncbi:hypothetical protein D3C86_2124600 [compost metagenome]
MWELGFHVVDEIHSLGDGIDLERFYEFRRSEIEIFFTICKVFRLNTNKRIWNIQALHVREVVLGISDFIDESVIERVT